MRLFGWAFAGFFFLFGVGFLVVGLVDSLLDRVSNEVTRDEVRLTFLIIGASFAGSGLLVGAIFAWILGKISVAKRLQTTGKRATATVLEVDDTGVTVNNDPRVRLKLRVQPESGPEFELDVKKIISRLTIPTPGMVLAIRYNPDDPDEFAWDDAGGDADGRPQADQVEAMVRQALAAKGVTGARQEEAVREALRQLQTGSSEIDLRRYTQGVAEAAADDEAASDPLDRLKKLAELRDSGVLTASEFEVQKAKILAGM